MVRGISAARDISVKSKNISAARSNTARNISAARDLSVESRNISVARANSARIVSGPRDISAARILSMARGDRGFDTFCFKKFRAQFLYVFSLR